MAAANIGKKVSFEIVSPYSDDFMGSVNTLRNEARKNNKINQKKIPFEIVSPYSDDFMGSVNTLRDEARKNNKVGMSLAEINKIIKSTRKEKNL